MVSRPSPLNFDEQNHAFTQAPANPARTPPTSTQYDPPPASIAVEMPPIIKASAGPSNRSIDQITQLGGSCTCPYVRRAIMTAPQASNALRAAISTPVAWWGCPGASKTTATSRMMSNKPRVPAARSGSGGNSRIRFRLIETATNT